MSAPIYWHGRIYILNRRGGSNLQDKFFEHFGFTWHRLFKSQLDAGAVIVVRKIYNSALPIHPDIAVARGNGNKFFTQKLHVQIANKLRSLQCRIKVQLLSPFRPT
jgi:hypothetical protein